MYRSMNKRNLRGLRILPCAAPSALKWLAKQDKPPPKIASSLHLTVDRREDEDSVPWEDEDSDQKPTSPRGKHEKKRIKNERKHNALPFHLTALSVAARAVRQVNRHGEGEQPETRGKREQ